MSHLSLIKIHFSAGEDSGETVMGWLMSFVVLSVSMAVLTIATLRQSMKTSAFALPALNLGDRLIAIFSASAFTVASIYGLTLLAAKVLL